MANKPELKPKTCGSGSGTCTGDEPINDRRKSKYSKLRSKNIREIIGLLECALDYKDYNSENALTDNDSNSENALTDNDSNSENALTDNDSNSENNKIVLVKGNIYNLKLKSNVPEEEEVELWNCVFLGSTQVKINRYSPEIGRSSVFREKWEKFDRHAIKIMCHFCVEEDGELNFIVQIDPEHIVQAKCRTSMLGDRTRDINENEINELIEKRKKDGNEITPEEVASLRLINQSDCVKNGGAKINIKRKTTTKTMKKKSTTTKKDKKGTTYKKKSTNTNTKKDKKGTKLLIKKIETP
jgi:hypothetical protein